jgi:hypothetical protein
MNTKSIFKSTKPIPNIKITKQDELDELDELSNLLEEKSVHSNMSNSTSNKNEPKYKPQGKSSIITKTSKSISDDSIKFGKTQFQSTEETPDLYENLELELLPKNYGNNSNLELELLPKNYGNNSNLELELLPKNYGNKWTDEDKKELISLLKQSANKEIDYTNIALKLGRSEGGVKGEIKKMIITRYLNGEEADLIAVDMNIQYKFIKILIKSYIENEIDTDINNLEKENKLLKLKMENMELRKNIFKLTNK